MTKYFMSVIRSCNNVVARGVSEGQISADKVMMLQ